MKKVRIIFLNLIILTATSLLLRSIGLGFQVYLSNKIGAEGIGLFQLIMAIFFLAFTLATSGIRLAATRLVAEELGTGNATGAKKAMNCCLKYSMFFSIITAILLFAWAKPIGTSWLGDSRTILSLRLLALALPFLAISSVFSGYFTAVRRVHKAAIVQVSEQLLRIGATVLALAIAPPDLEYACAAIVVGCCVGEFCSFLLLSILYRQDISQYNHSSGTATRIPRRMLNIALPVAFSAYITSAIRTVQQLLIPAGLRKAGASSQAALATYGTINGMVMPIIMFPATFLHAISDLIVPELAECQAQGRVNRFNYIISRVLNLGILSSILVMIVFFRFGKELGEIIYKSSEAGYFLYVLSFIVPIIYLDTIVDGMLKGMGQQLSSMGYNILESLVGVTLVYYLLPHYAIAGYIFTLFVTRTINFVLSLHRLLKVTRLHLDILFILKSGFSILNSVVLSNFIFQGIGIEGSTVTTLVQIAAIGLVYLLLLRGLNCITDEDISWFKSIWKNG